MSMYLVTLSLPHSYYNKLDFNVLLKKNNFIFKI